MHPYHFVTASALMTSMLTVSRCGYSWLSEGSSDAISGRSKRMEKGRRVWTPKEEETLLLSMKELVAQGWKSDNGFRAGYLNKLEDSFKKKMPGTDLKGSPHMNSKLSIWKKDYNSLCTILNQSGVGFNCNGSYTIDCDDALWDSIIKIDSNAKRIQKKSWPMYEDWKEIFGKDIANGEGAFDYYEAINYLEQEYASVDDGYNPGDDHHVDLEDLISTDGATNNSYHNDHPTVQSELSPSPSASKGKGVKRKVVDGIDKVCALIEGMSRNANSRMETIASRFGHEAVLGQARMEIFNKLPVIDGFTTRDKLSVCEIFIENDKKLELFLGLPEDANAEYVIRLLGCN